MDEYPISFREGVLKRIFGLLKSGESFYVVGAPSAGKTRILDFMTGDDPDILRGFSEGVDRERIKKHYLGDDVAAKTWLVRVDMNRMRQELEWSFLFYELLLHTILLACNRAESTEQMKEIRLQLAALDSEVIDSKDALRAHRFFEMAVNLLCQSYGMRLCFLFDEFDVTYQTMPRDVFAQLRAIRDANKYRVSYALLLRNLPERLRDPIENEGFYELFSRNPVGLGPYSAEDTRYIIGRLEKRHDHAMADNICEWISVNSGGHPGLIQALFMIFKNDRNAITRLSNVEWFVKQESVEEEFRKIWAGLLADERAGLLEFSRGNQNNMAPATGKLLIMKGLVKPGASGGMRVFTPLLENWIQ